VGGSRKSDWRDEEEGEHHRCCKAIDSAHCRETGEAVGKHDVDRKERGVRESEREARRLAAEARVREEVDTERGSGHGCPVATGASADQG
jgi:DICT domain-containing protein